MSNKKKSHLGENIRSFRKNKGWTQKDLAQKLECSQTVVAAYENNRRMPLADKIIQMAELFNVSYDQLFGSTETKPTVAKSKTTKLWKLFEEVDSLPPQEKTVLIKMIEGLIASSKK